MNNKAWYTSKTLWFNVATVAAAVAAGLVGLLPTVQFLFTPQGYAVTVTVIGLINLGLRSVTKEAIWFATKSQS